MLSREKIKEELVKILIAQKSKFAALADTITEQSKLRTDLGLESIQMLYLVIVIEEKFQIQIENIGINDFVTLSDVIDYIESKQT